MSQDRYDADATGQWIEARSNESDPAPASDLQASAATSSDVSVKPDTELNSAPATGSEPSSGFVPVTIRSYLTEQFGVREVTTPSQHAAPLVPPTDAKAELAKWRERVPKLASALKERGETIDLLQAELAQLQARDDQIAALEGDLEALTTSYRNSEECVRTQDLELQALRLDLEAAADALVVQAANAAQAQTLQEEQLVGLEERNQNLYETTELANRQLALLSEDVTRLQAELANQEQAFATQLTAQEQHNLLEIAQIQAEHSERLRDIHTQTVLVFEAVEQQNLDEQRRAVASAQASVELKMHVDYVDLQQAAQGLMQQLRHLQMSAAQQQRDSDAASEHYAQALRAQADAHRHALANLTLALEGEFDVQRREQQKEQQRLARLVEADQPQVTMLGAISDNSAGRSDFAQAWRSLDDGSVESANETIQELERVLKIRNEELSAAVAARVHFLPAASSINPRETPVADADSDGLKLVATHVSSALSASDSVTSLQQQLNSAQTENERLRQQLERTSAALSVNDDLTQLKGVGGKLAEQLRSLGITQFAQMAAIDLADLASPDHPLFNLKSRIERDGWIEQAKALVHPLTLYEKE